MPQPKWKFITNLGDVNPVDFDGYFVYIDETGIYPPEMEALIHSMEDDTWYVYRVVMENHTFIDGILSDNKYHPDFRAWYADGLESVASTVGRSSLELINDLCSPDPVARASAYLDLTSYYGWYEFDQSPLVIYTEDEVRARYTAGEV